MLFLVLSQVQTQIMDDSYKQALKSKTQFVKENNITKWKPSAFIGTTVTVFYDKDNQVINTSYHGMNIGKVEFTSKDNNSFYRIHNGEEFEKFIKKNSEPFQLILNHILTRWPSWSSIVRIGERVIDFGPQTDEIDIIVG